jgi:SPOR domain
MATSVSTPLTSEIWHLSIDDLLEPLPETPRLGGPGPFVINLSASTAPIGLPMKAITEVADVHVYQIQRLEDRRTRYRLRLGPFDSEDAAEALLAAVRELYPSALTATADFDDFRAIDKLKSKAEAQRQPKVPAKAAPAEPVLIDVAAPAPKSSDPAAAHNEPLAAKPPAAWLALLGSGQAAPAAKAAPSAVPAAAAIPAATATATAPKPAAAAAAPVTPTATTVARVTPVAPARAAAPVAPVAAARSAPVASAVPETRAVNAAAVPSVTAKTSAVPPSVTAPPKPAAAPIASTPASSPLAAPAQADIDPSTIPVLSDAVEVVRRAPPPVNESSAMPSRQAASPPMLEHVVSISALKGAAPKVARPAVRPLQSIAAPAPVTQKAVPPQAKVSPAPKAAPKAPPVSVSAPSVARPAVPPPKAPAVKIAPPSATVSSAPVTRIGATAAPKPAPAAVEPAPRRVEALNTPIPDFESTQTLRPLTQVELHDGAALRWFVIQLAQSEEGFDPDALPNLDIFDEYRLYSVAGVEEGKVMHALRLGFFAEEGAAKAVAGYLAAFYEKPVVKRISVAERTRFSDQRVEARKDIGATGRHTVIEITDDLRAKRAPSSTVATMPVRAVGSQAGQKTK